MGLNKGTRVQGVTFLVTLVLLLLTAAFPYAEYNYSAGMPRGPIVWEFNTQEIHYPPNDATLLGRGSYFHGEAIIPCWNIAGKSLRWDWTAIQAAVIVILGGLAFYLNRPSTAASREHAQTSADTAEPSETA